MKNKSAPSKGNPYATNKGGVIKATRPMTDSPKSEVTKGNDLRNGNGKKK